MSTSSIIRIGGVPEHFNLPIHQAMEDGAFESRGVQVEWTTFTGGTGQMTKAMRAGEVDVCVLLTEGILTDIIHGNPAKIISEYIKTPLIWGIHTGANNDLQAHEDIFNRQYAISRFGSGSHLMAMVDANQKGRTIDTQQFSVIGNLEGALSSLEENTTDVFYWEKFTTKPYVDKGQLRRVGEFLTPWPCFVLAATDDIIDQQPDNLIRVLRTIHDYCDRFMQAENSIKQVSERYHQRPEDVARWFHSTEWAIHGWVSEKMLKSVLYHLREANIVAADAEIPDFIWRREAR